MPKDLNDITSFLTKVKALKPDVLIVSGHEKGAATAARQMAELQIQVPLVGMTHCEVGQGDAGLPEGLGRLRLPDAVGRDHEGGRSDVRHRGRTTTTQIKAAYDYKVVPYQTAQASRRGLCLGGRVQARQFARQGEAARGADQDRPGNLLRRASSSPPTAAIPARKSSCGRSSTANTMSCGRKRSPRPS